MTGEMEWALTGKWRIIEADLWGRDYLAPVEPAHITFEGNGHGEFTFGCVNGGLDCEYSRQIIFFTWQGFDEMDEVSGDGSAKLDDDGSLETEVRFHLGDEAILKAQNGDFQQPASLILDLEVFESFVELGQLAAAVHEPVNARPSRMGFWVDVQFHGVAGLAPG